MPSDLIQKQISGSVTKTINGEAQVKFGYKVGDGPWTILASDADPALELTGKVPNNKKWEITVSVTGTEMNL